MAHSSWAWAYENYQVPKKSHEHHNNDSNDRTLQKYGTQKVELSEMGFSLSQPSQEIPTKMGFFTPSLMNRLCSLHQLSLSLLFYFVVSGTL